MLHIKKAISSEDLIKCLDIRVQVFVKGQSVPIEEERDGKDHESMHYLLLLDEHPAGVARVRDLGNYFKIERVAILDEHQGKGLGRDIMTFILSDLNHSSPEKKVKLSSQSHAIPFYEKLGFSVCSDEYMDAGIPHKDMEFLR